MVKNNTCHHPESYSCVVLVTGSMFFTGKATFSLQQSLKLVLNKYVLSQALRSCSLKNERSESMTNKPVSYKNLRSPAPLHKKKPSHGPHGLVRSSGYGKPSLLSKQSFPVSEKRTPKETFKKTCMKARSPADRAKSKGNSKF